MHRSLRLFVAITLALASVGCRPTGGGGSGGNGNDNGNGNGAGPAYDVSGTWDIVLESTSLSGDCDGEVGDTDSFAMEFTQTGTRIQVGFPSFGGQTVDGSISGSQITWGGTLSVDEGQLTFTDAEMNVRSPTFMDGSASWRWTSEDSTCSGSSNAEGQARRPAVVLGGRGDGDPVPGDDPPSGTEDPPSGTDDPERPDIEDDFGIGTCADVCEALFGEFLPEESRDCIARGISGTFPEVFDVCENPETRSDCTACLRTVGAGDGECREIANSCVGQD